MLNNYTCNVKILQLNKHNTVNKDQFVEELGKSESLCHPGNHRPVSVPRLIC